MCNVKFCENCKEYKARTDFTDMNIQSKDICNGCKRNKQRDTYYKENYDITLEEYNDFYINQDGRCFICTEHQSRLSKRLAVDHNHKTGKVRGLLCSKCNTALGLLQDNISNVYRMLLYLKASESNS